MSLLLTQITFNTPGYDDDELFFFKNVDRRKALSLISCWDHCQGFSLLQTSGMPPTGFEPCSALFQTLLNQAVK